MTDTLAPAPVQPRRRSGGTLGDMARTVLVMAVVVFAIVFVAKDRTDHTAVKRVDSDLALTVTQAARVSPFPLLAPVGLPSTWAPTSVMYGTRPGLAAGPAAQAHPVFHVGWVTPTGSYADLEESDAPVGPALAGYAGKGSTAQGQIRIAGRPVSLAVAKNGTVTLTETTVTEAGAGHGMRTYLGVTGGASQAQLTQLLTSLRPAA